MTYAGTQHLTVVRDGKSVRFEAQASYARTGPDARSNAQAEFVQVLKPDGSLEDAVDDDPDFLTVLNQPFAVQLDRATLRDVRALRRPVPFAATSPLGGSTVLHGFLRPGVNGPIEGRPTVAVRFQANGPMNGVLPGHAGDTVSGSMHMDGTAYYALDDAMLLGLRVTLTVDAQLRQRHPTLSEPVRIVYRRSIRAAQSVSDR